jgi:serine/threonine protein kinase
LNHENIVSVRRVFEANNSAYMLLDFIDGRTLEDWLRSLNGAPTQEELDVLSIALMSALEFVHAKQLWHLDVSPDNVMIRSRDGVPILVDFGASRLEIKQHSRLGVDLQKWLLGSGTVYFEHEPIRTVDRHLRVRCDPLSCRQQ